MRPGLVLMLCALLYTLSGHAVDNRDTIKLYFRLGESTISLANMRYLDSLAYINHLPVNKQYGIIGYADFLGSDSSNLHLSELRAKNVGDYLLGFGIRPDSIATITGKGEIERNEEHDSGYPEDRRVDIVIGGLRQNKPTPLKAQNIYGKKWQIFFQSGNNIPLPGSDTTISQIVKYMKEQPGAMFKISGYHSGDDETVMISFDRCWRVKWMIAGQKQDTNRISTPVAYGDMYAKDKSQPQEYFRRADVEVVTLTPQKQIDISTVAKNESIRLDNILFLPGSHKIREESSTTLFDLYITMKDNPGLKITIEGHICCLNNTNTDGYDYDTREFSLSVNRAREVYDYLVKQGIDASRLVYKGYGISKPLKWPERSVYDENLNRRVEIRITEK